MRVRIPFLPLFLLASPKIQAGKVLPSLSTSSSFFSPIFLPSSLITKNGLHGIFFSFFLSSSFLDRKKKHSQNKIRKENLLPLVPPPSLSPSLLHSLSLMLFSLSRLKMTTNGSWKWNDKYCCAAAATIAATAAAAAAGCCMYRSVHIFLKHGTAGAPPPAAAATAAAAGI